MTAEQDLAQLRREFNAYKSAVEGAFKQVGKSIEKDIQARLLKLERAPLKR